MRVVSSIESLISGSMPAADILIERDPGAGRARVTVNGRLISEGRCGEFNPSHAGGWHLDLAERHGRWASPETLADTLERCLSRLPNGCVVTRSLYISSRG